MLDQEQANRVISPERFNRYLRAAGWDFDLAMKLYVWNAEASAAVMVSVGHLEVGLRNKIHEVLKTWSQNKYGDLRWFDYIRGDLNQRHAETLDKVLESFKNTPRDGDVVAGLTFGFWWHFLTKKYDRTLWRDVIHRAFDSSAPGRKAIEKAVSDLHKIRNRVAHNEHLLNEDLTIISQNIETVAGRLDPSFQQWIQTHSQIDAINKKKPIRITCA